MLKGFQLCSLVVSLTAVSWYSDLAWPCDVKYVFVGVFSASQRYVGLPLAFALHEGIKA